MNHSDPDIALGRLFDGASKLPKAERAAWLDEHCKDVGQRRRVEELLVQLDEGLPAIDDGHLVEAVEPEPLPETIGD